MKNFLKYALISIALISLTSCFSSKKQNCDAYGKLEIQKPEETKASEINAKLEVEETQNS